MKTFFYAQKKKTKMKMKNFVALTSMAKVIKVESRTSQGEHTEINTQNAKKKKLKRPLPGKNGKELVSDQNFV